MAPANAICRLGTGSSCGVTPNSARVEAAAGLRCPSRLPVSTQGLLMAINIATSTRGPAGTAQNALLSHSLPRETVGFFSPLFPQAAVPGREGSVLRSAGAAAVSRPGEGGRRALPGPGAPAGEKQRLRRRERR